MKKNKDNLIIDTASIQDAVKKLDLYRSNSLVIHNNKKKVTGMFTMGDFRRAIFFGLDVTSKLSTVINKDFKYLIEGFSKNEVKKIFTNNELITDIPVLNKKFQLLNIINRYNFFSSKELAKKKINLNKFPVVIMAGGKGTRLDPFTRILPKSLIPFGRNPIIRVIMDYFMEFGLKKFHISLNDKSSMIKAYFHDLKSSYDIRYVEEKKPLGTAGSLKLLKKNLKNTFFVTNSDILIQSDYPSIIEFHRKNNYDLTLVSSVRNYTIPYGICNFDKEGKLKSIEEKPEYNFLVNTGLYLVEPKVLDLIPANKKFDMIELINKIKKKRMKVGIFPVTENSWKDIGNWTEYTKNVTKLIV